MRIVLSGSSSGIGRALADALTVEGHEVLGLARSSQPQAQFATAVCDVASWEAVSRLALPWPQVDAIICAAAIQGEIGPAMSVDPECWSATVRTNLDGTYFLLRALWAQLSNESRRAKVICFSGGGATKARPNFSAYAASKTAVVRLVETLAVECAGLNINAIAPGAINTRMTEQTAQSVGAGPEVEAAQRQLTTGGQPIEKVLELVKWLLSAESDGITGRLLSAQWDPWQTLAKKRERLADSEIYQLRRILPEERGALLNGAAYRHCDRRLRAHRPEARQCARRRAARFCLRRQACPGRVARRDRARLPRDCELADVLSSSTQAVVIATANHALAPSRSRRCGLGNTCSSRNPARSAE